MEIDVRSHGRADVIVMRGHLKQGDPVDELCKTLDGLLAGGHLFVVANIADVEMADSTGLGALVRYQAILKRKGGAIKLVQPSKLVLQTLKLCCLSSMFEIFNHEIAAIQSFPEPAAAG